MEKTNLEMIRGDTFSFAFEVDFDEAISRYPVKKVSNAPDVPPLYML